MSYDYSENILVQEAAGNLLEHELGWEVKFAYNTEVLGADGTFGRKSYKDILLVRYFRNALKVLNPWITPMQMDEAQRKMESYLSTASLMQINEEKYALIRDGIPVTVKKPNGQSEEKKAQIVDFQNPTDQSRNHFLAIKELKIHGEYYRRRTDIVGFVNGIPLLFVELKKNTVDVQNAYDDNYTDYLDTIPHLFHYNAFLMLSNGVEAKVGTLGSKYEFFHEWKRLSEADEGNVALETMLRGICKKENFFDLLENFILYDHSDGRTVKILARNHQYLGVNEAVKAYETRKLRDGKLGVFWHTQGSGKSYSMVFLSAKIRRKFSGSPTIVVLTDRDELNKQISDTFENCGLLGAAKASQFIASSGANLVQKLQGKLNHIHDIDNCPQDKGNDRKRLVPFDTNAVSAEVDHISLIISDDNKKMGLDVYLMNKTDHMVCIKCISLDCNIFIERYNGDFVYKYYANSRPNRFKYSVSLPYIVLNTNGETPFEVKVYEEDENELATKCGGIIINYEAVRGSDEQLKLSIPVHLLIDAGDYSCLRILFFKPDFSRGGTKTMKDYKSKPLEPKSTRITLTDVTGNEIEYRKDEITYDLFKFFGLLI